MIPINYGVITGGSTWGWRLPCKVPRIQLSCHPETICLVIFVDLFLRKVLKKSDQQLRAFSPGFNQLTSVLHSENASKD
jgi:hypothetical protein